MTCNAKTFFEIFAGDNQEIPITITQDGERVPNIQTETSEITFQAKDASLVNIIDMNTTASADGVITLDVEQNDEGNDIDVARLKPTIVGTNKTPGTYDIFMRIDRNAGADQDHIEMSKDGVIVTQIKIKKSGIT